MIGTFQDNMKDMAKKGRASNNLGEKTLTQLLPLLKFSK